MEEKGKKWSRLSNEVIEGVIRWRQEQGKATINEIEGEIDRRLNKLRAEMIGDVAGGNGGLGKGVVCQDCGGVLEARGKKKRELQTQGGEWVVVEREYGVCPQCKRGYFPPG